jgi:hypothetical protein
MGRAESLRSRVVKPLPAHSTDPFVTFVSFVLKSGQPYDACAVSCAAFIRRARRDLRREAAFLWMMPRLAALSTRLAVCWMKVVACSSPAVMAARDFFMNVLIAERTDWFRSARMRETRRLRTAD